MLATEPLRFDCQTSMVVVSAVAPSGYAPVPTSPAKVAHELLKARGREISVLLVLNAPTPHCRLGAFGETSYVKYP